MYPESSIRECTIFNSEKYNEAALNNNIFVFGTYKPKNEDVFSNHEFSRRYIDNIKNICSEDSIREENKRALRYFLCKFEYILNFDAEFTICVIPSSQKGLQFSGIRLIAKLIADYPNDAIYEDEDRFFIFSDTFVQKISEGDKYLIQDGTNVLVRNRTIQKKSRKNSINLGVLLNEEPLFSFDDLENQRGNILYEINALEVQDIHLIKGKQVLLLDDVTTSGTSLKAGREVLLKAGARIVVPFALAETRKYGKYQKFGFEIKI